MNDTIELPEGATLIDSPAIELPEGATLLDSPAEEPSPDLNYQKNLEAAKHANDMSVKYDIPFDHAERIATALQKKDQDERDLMTGTVGVAPEKV